MKISDALGLTMGLGVIGLGYWAYSSIIGAGGLDKLISDKWNELWNGSQIPAIEQTQEAVKEQYGTDPTNPVNRLPTEGDWWSQVISWLEYLVPRGREALQF